MLWSRVAWMESFSLFVVDGKFFVLKQCNNGTMK